MLKLAFAKKRNAPCKVLCLGAHSDDLEIGCGGTILRLTEHYRNIVVYWVIFSADKIRRKEAVTSATTFLNKATKKQIVIKNFKDSFLPFAGSEIKVYFNRLKRQFSPDLIFTHYRHDLHQDHRLISELTWNTFRDHVILEYEIPKYDGDIGSPNMFIHLSEAICKRKISCIVNEFGSQRDKVWFSEETFYSILRLRGIESNAPSRYAEAFYFRKMIY